MARTLLSVILAPLGMERFWLTLLWAVSLAVGVALWDWVEAHFREAAAGQTVLLLPAEPLDDTQRQAVLRMVSQDPAVASANWRSPADLSRIVMVRFPQAEWARLFPADDAWMPWVLEVRPRPPLESHGLIQAFIRQREQEGSWRLVLWDNILIQNLSGERAAVRAAAGMFVILVGVCGAAALKRMVWPTRGGAALAVWSAVAGALAPAAVGSAALLAGELIPGRTLAIGAGAGFLLAAALAPMLRQPRRKTISTTVREASDERSWQGSGPGH